MPLKKSPLRLELDAYLKEKGSASREEVMNYLTPKVPAPEAIRHIREKNEKKRIRYGHTPAVHPPSYSQEIHNGAKSIIHAMLATAVKCRTVVRNPDRSYSLRDQV